MGDGIESGEAVEFKKAAETTELSVPDSYFERVNHQPVFVAAQIRAAAEVMLTQLPTDEVSTGGYRMRVSQAGSYGKGDNSYVLQIGRDLDRHGKPTGYYKLIKDRLYTAPIATVNDTGEPMIYKPSGPYGLDEFSPSEITEIGEHVKELGLFARSQAEYLEEKSAKDATYIRERRVRRFKRLAIVALVATGGAFGYAPGKHYVEDFLHEREVASAQEQAREQAKQARIVAAFDKLGITLTDEEFAGGTAGRAVADARLKDLKAPQLDSDAGAKDFVEGERVRAIDAPDPQECNTEKLPTSARAPEYEIGAAHDGSADDVITVRISADKSSIKICSFGTIDDGEYSESDSANHVYVQARPVVSNNG